MIIDFHTHCFPDALAPKALGWLSDKAGFAPTTDGTVKGSIQKLKETGVDIGVVCSIATNAHQLPKVNSFAIDINDFSTRLIALGSAHPDSEIFKDELDRLRDHDIKGIKVHPEYGPYYIDSEPWLRVFRLAAERGLFVVTHAGYDFISPDRIAATPERLARVLDAVPDLRLIAAHLGGNRHWNEVKSHLCGRDNVWFDTALLAREGADPTLVREVILSHRIDRVLFGSDMPWSDPREEIALIRSLSLGNEAEESIFHRNAEELLW